MAGLTLLASACQLDLAGIGPALGNAAGAEVPADRQLAVAHRQLGLGLEEAGDIGGAVADFEAALAADPWLTPGGVGIDATPYGDLARICAGGGPDAAVIRACSIVMGSLRFPAERLPEFLVLRGAALARSGDYDRAEADLDAALKIDSSDPEALITRGGLRERSGNRGGAFADYNLALLRRPDWAPALYGRGRMRAAAGEYEKAVEDFDAVLASPEGVADYPDAYRDRARAHCRLGSADAAAIGWQTWMQVVPGGAEYLHDLLRWRGYLRAPGEDFGAAELAGLRAWTRAGCPARDSLTPAG